MDILTQKLVLARGPVLVPVNAYDLEQIEKLPLSRNYATRITFAQSDPVRRFYWALIGVVAEGLGISKDYMHAKMRRECGLIEHIFPDGSVVLGSTKRTRMDGPEQLAYVRLAKEKVFEVFIPGLNARERRAVLKRVEEITG